MEIEPDPKTPTKVDPNAFNQPIPGLKPGPRAAMPKKTDEQNIGKKALHKALELSKLAEELPQFHILDEIDRGGMGVVYKAVQRTLNRLVALKVISSKIADQPQFTKRFKREAYAMARLYHPNIVLIHDFDSTPNGRHYLVLEYIDCVTLREIMRGARVEPRQALQIILPICEALQFAHEKGLCIAISSRETF